MQANLVISRDAAVVPRKMDWLLTERLDEIRTIMNDNGTYIQMPSVGSQASLITVFGDHRTNIERSIRQIMALVSHTAERKYNVSSIADITDMPILHGLVLALATEL